MSSRKSGRKPYRTDRKRKSSEKAYVKSGKVIAHADGYGFVRLGAGRDSDVFISIDQMRGVLHGDTISVRIIRKRGRMSAEVLKVIKPASDTITGQYSSHRGGGIVEPRSRRVPLSVHVRKEDSLKARDGDWVRVKIDRRYSPLRGTIVKVLGDVLAPSRLIDLLVGEQSLRQEFPANVLSEAEKTPERVSRSDHKDRLDLTHLPFVTIDGEDAKDFDDAICVIPRGDGFELWVAIADVGHYVQPDSAIDKEARQRGNSFYFPDRVIPMLPEVLSNGICSLKPDVERLAMTIRMRFDAGGRRRAVHISEALIRSRARLTYTQVAEFLEDESADTIPEATLKEMIYHAVGLHRLMAKSRRRRGTIDLDLPDMHPVVEQDSVTRIEVREQNIAHRLIEEFMLAANTAVAHYLEKKKVALLYRSHEPPGLDAIRSLNEFFAPFGIFIRVYDGKPPHPKDFQRALEEAADKPHQHAFSRLILRSMKQACYSPDNAGHFGLAFKSYTHFTSPIRRYADLTVHRRLRAVLRKENPDAVQPASELATIGQHVSAQERIQMQAEWDSTAMLAALYHQKDVGKEFDAMIAGVSEHSIFLELQPSMAEAAVSVAYLGRFELDKRRHRLVQPRSGKTYALGDRMRICLESTDPVRGQIRASLLQDKY
ncbi:MAG: ribonuclease R [Mariprofundaceae bacterium]